VRETFDFSSGCQGVGTRPRASLSAHAVCQRLRHCSLCMFLAERATGTAHSPMNGAMSACLLDIVAHELTASNSCDRGLEEIRMLETSECCIASLRSNHNCTRISSLTHFSPFPLCTEELEEVRRREKERGLQPDYNIHAFMAVRQEIIM